MKTKLIIYILIFLMTKSMAQNNTPQAIGDIYYFNVGDLYFAVNASHGGRVSSFKFKNNELLFNAPEADENGTLWGSVLWPSPQSGGDKGWGWPPSKIIDIEPYSAQIIENKIVVTSKKDTYKSGLQVTKYYWGNEADSSVTTQYVMKNITNKTFRVAPWEVTRVPSGGIAYFPQGDNKIWGDLGDNFELIDGHYWYKYDAGHKVNKKAFADGGPGGWSAFLNDDGMLFIKKFEDITHSQIAPQEDEIEQWLSNLGYIELENQGAYVSLDPGDSLVWDMKWYLVELPSGIEAKVGNPELINAVNEVINMATFSLDIDSENSIALDIYPNPNDGNYLNLFSSKEPIEKVEIIGITGQRVFEKNNINTQKVRLNHLNIRPGVYVVRVKTENGIIGKRLVVQ